jgi:CARDB
LRRSFLALFGAVVTAAMFATIATAQAQEEPLPDLTVQKTGPSTASPGDLVRYNIIVSNIGSGIAIVGPGEVLLRDETTVNIGTPFKYATGGPANYIVNTKTVGDKVITEAAHRAENGNDGIYPASSGRAPYQFSVDIQLQPDSKGSITNCATVDPNDEVSESNESNNTTCVSTKVGEPQPQPKTKDDCKNSGWRKFKDESGKPLFKNQGQCIKHVNHENKK